MSPGAPRKYTHSLADAIALVRRLPAFAHLRGQVQAMIGHVANLDLWPERDATVYRNLWTRFSHDRTILSFAEVWGGRSDKLNASELLRRLAFVYGAKCRACGEVSHFLRCLPIDRDDMAEATRAPFDDAEFPNVMEPLCQPCRRSFQKLVRTMAGETPSAATVDACASAWVAHQVTRQAAILRRAA